MEKLFLTVLSMSGTASIVILAVLLARLALRKAPKAFSYALWAVVLFRLLCPFSIESAFSLAPKVQVKPRDRDNSDLVTIDVSRREVTITVDDAPVVLPETPDAPAVPGAPNLPQPDAPVPAAPAAPEPWFIAGVVWLTGAGLLMGCSLLSLLRLRRRLAGHVPLAGEENVRLADHIPSPFVLGLVRPRIYLPSDLPERERDYVLLHERTHIRRFDHVTRALAWLALTVHWFNPLGWLAFYLAGKDMEMSCDEAVLRKIGREIRVDYSSSLLRLSAGGRLPAGPLAFGGGNLQGRIKNVLRYKKPALWVIGLAFIAVMCAGAALATDFGGTRQSFDAGIDRIPADLTLSLDEEGTFVRIEGSVDGVVLDHTLWFAPSWYKLYDDTDYPLGRLAFDMPLCGGEVGCELDACWTDESRSAVRVTATPRMLFSSYHEPGNLIFTVDLSDGALLELKGYIPKMHANAPELVPTEAEAVWTASIAARLLTEAENYYRSHAGERSPQPVPEPTTVPSPTPTPGPAISDLLENMLSCDGWTVKFWGVFPGSGPLMLELDGADCGERLRDILTALNWQEGEGEEAPMEEYRELDQWVQFYSTGGNFAVYPGNDTVVVHFTGEPFGEAVWHANGTENLCRDLLDLWPGPEAYYFRVRKVEYSGDAQTMAEDYAAAFEAVYRNSGAITDFRLDSVTGKLDDGWCYADLSFAVKPADPDLRAWKGWASHRVTADRDGWVKYTCRIYLSPRDVVYDGFQYE